MMTTFFRGTGSGMRATILLGAVALLCSCQPYNGEDEGGGGLTVTLGSNEMILLDAPARSCRAELEAATSDDVAPLHMNMRRLGITWDGEANTSLRVIYVKLNIVSGGLSNNERPITIASQDLSCLMNFTLAETVVLPVTPQFTFMKDLLIGGLKATDTDLRRSFSGSVNVIVYALKKKAGGDETPLVGRASARFNFQGI